MPHQVNDVPHDMVVLYPRALQQEYGWSGGYAISKFGTTSPDIPKTWASSVQLELIERIVNYIIDHELFCLFGMNGKKFFIALESKQDAILLKLSS